MCIIEIDKKLAYLDNCNPITTSFSTTLSSKSLILSVSTPLRVTIRIVVASRLQPLSVAVLMICFILMILCVVLSMNGIARPEQSINQSSSAIFNFFDRYNEAKNVALLV